MFFSDVSSGISSSSQLSSDEINLVTAVSLHQSDEISLVTAVSLHQSDEISLVTAVSLHQSDEISDESSLVTAVSLHQSEISFQAEHFNLQTTSEPNLSTTSSVHSVPQFVIAEPINNSEFNFVDPIIPTNTDDHSSNNSREFSLDLEQSAVQTTDEQPRLLVTCLSNLSNLLVTSSNLESSELHLIQNELQNCLYLVSNQLSASNESENRFADSTYTPNLTSARLGYAESTETINDQSRCPNPTETENNSEFQTDVKLLILPNPYQSTNQQQTDTKSSNEESCASSESKNPQMIQNPQEQIFKPATNVIKNLRRIIGSEANEPLLAKTAIENKNAVQSQTKIFSLQELKLLITVSFAASISLTFSASCTGVSYFLEALTCMIPLANRYLAYRKDSNHTIYSVYFHKKHAPFTYYRSHYRDYTQEKWDRFCNELQKECIMFIFEAFTIILFIVCFMNTFSLMIIIKLRKHGCFTRKKASDVNISKQWSSVLKVRYPYHTTKLVDIRSSAPN